MFIALTTDDNRISIEDALPGENYLCPVCGNMVVVKAANSNNVRTHFAHRRNSLCLDNWKHDMSDWHFDWQSKFPIECREVVVKDGTIVHRADVLINNTVIEFQHSPISGEEFEARNNFYKNCGYRVVWLFDATDKIKPDECSGLVWKRKTTLFSSMKTPIDAFYIQHFLPEKGDELLWIVQSDPKEIFYHRTIFPIRPANFLKEYGAIQDDSIPSIRALFELKKVKEQYDFYNAILKKQEALQHRALVNNRLNPVRRRRRGRF